MKSGWGKKISAILAVGLVLSLGTGLIWQAVAEKAAIEGGQVKDYGQIYQVFKRRRLEQLKSHVETGIMDGAADFSAAGAGIQESADTAFSKTNVQEAGVDEADVVKTDGEFLYVLRDNSVHILRTRGAEMEPSAVLKPQKEEERYLSLYLWQDTLVVLKEHVEACPAPRTEPGTIAEDRAVAGDAFTGVDLYSLGDRSAPRLEGSYSQDGYYANSRMVDGYLYLITHKNNMYEPAEEEPATFIPAVIERGERTLLPPEAIYMNPDIENSRCAAEYLVISGLNVEAGGEKSSARAVLGYGGNVYASRENLYLAGYTEMGDKTRYTSGSQLLRFSMNSGKVELAAEGKVEGTVDDQFSMSEQGDTFRLVTTVDSYGYIEEDTRYSSPANSGGQDSRTNRLYVLGLDFQQKGLVKDLAPGERVYSCRFMGDTAYFVTFRNTDPLFAVDLSDPENPQVLSALKIPGFSEYLHPFGDGRLLGLGRDADEETGEIGKVKLSMFDISDPRAVSERSKLLTMEQYSEALYDHKAVLASPERNIIAFPGEQNYLIYSYKEDEGFVLNKAVKFTGAGFGGGFVRGQYIGDYLYVTGQNGVAALHMEDYSIVNTYYYG